MQSRTYRFPLATSEDAAGRSGAAVATPPGGAPLGASGWATCVLAGGATFVIALVLLVLHTVEMALTGGVVTAALGLSIAIYVCLDLAYVFLVEMRFIIEPLYRKHGTKATLGDGPGRLLYLAPIFFPLAMLACTFLCILPSYPTRDLLGCAAKGWMCGAWAYSNMSLVMAWSVPRYPIELIALTSFSGAALSCLTSVISLAILDAIGFEEDAVAADDNSTLLGIGASLGY